jgi:hypothetical protein
MTIAIVSAIAIGCYAAGIFTMAALYYRRGALDERLAATLIPPRPPMPPPPRQIEPQRPSPFAPRPKPPERKPVEPLARRKPLLHWPIPVEKPPAEAAPAPTAGPARACLPDNEWRSS